MSKFKKIIDKSVLENDTKTMNRITAVIDEHLSELEIEHPDMYWDVIFDLHEAVYGSHFDEGMAMYAVSQMKNKDGSTGAHWSLSETTAAAKSEGVEFGAMVNEFDWYYALNMTYSDHYDVVGSDTSLYIRLTKSWINDPDSPDGKAFKYYSCMC